METLSTTKRSLSYEDINETNPPKKHKANTVINITNMNQQKSLPNKEFISLSERMRPTCIDDYIGQENVIGSHTILKQMLIKGHIPNMILWGPPGCGKTSLANVISKLIKEIHGEKVHITNLSATSSGMVIEWLAEICDGDARVALNSLDLAVKSKVSNELSPSHLISITLEDVKESLKQAHTLSDKHNNTHHLYSALHKSIKAGKENASLYWLARIMAVKEDPVDIARRLVRISSEDIGLADPDALGIAVHTMDGCQMIGMPECDVILTQCVIYLTRAPKSQLVYNALKSVKNIIINHKGPQPTVPIHIRDNTGQEKHYASFGCQEANLLHKEKDVQTYLPFSLQHVDFFSES